MSIAGYLSEFSLGELLRSLEEGNKCGCLLIRAVAKQLPTLPLAKSVKPQMEVRLFFSQGQIVAATSSPEVQGLQHLLEKGGWLRASTLERLLQVRPLTTPLGLYLKEQGILASEDLQLLFKQQVLTPIPHLFALKEGWFEFSSSSSLPWIEMTGLRASPRAISLTGLRLLQDWTPLLDKLPLATSTLVSTIEGSLPYRLDPQEWQVWEYVNSNLTLQEIAEYLSVAVLEVQKVSFRLIVAGLVEEVPQISGEDDTAIEPTLTVIKPPKPLSRQFLEQFLNFLKVS
ncbi:MAG: DUF4388 domain-containing protein [Thermosynechococcus sp.]|uniref:DUF4388 domain-containing protein n=1 Tax=Thermosynechococcus sp. TaxID=2814275 RepID=UPI00391C9A1D